ncbi:hypothetical protein RSOLAG1IB_09256 [Rhizoctonia solani AG-1 IB]|uniref:Uncharacterized protein n=1 Tax=Thanatephorus cucumeris (strain AG1-IB / isolate 7/3/14) TaxID=1108050 RepID=A0A0B7FSX8_THACB|nr:hypothetical protein RSOLAG1IB_09256 [Rhizoctonia solani AG-1 IB]
MTRDSFLTCLNFSMSLARLRIIAPRLTCRALSSSTPLFNSTSQPQAPGPPSNDGTPRDPLAFPATESIFSGLLQMGVRSDAGLPYSEALGPNIKPEPQSQSHGLPPAGISRQPFGRGKKRVRLFVQFAGKRDLQYLKDFPTEPFELLVSNLKQASAGIVPLGFDVSQKGNLLIDFPKHTSREALESNLDLIRNTLNIDQDIPVILVINQSSVCIAGVPTRLRPDGLVFSEAELVESLLKNPAIAALTITSQPRWLHKPENDIPPRSSVVFRFDDPEGAIAESLCRTPIYVFGALVRVKPRFNNYINTIQMRPLPPA